MQTEIRELDTTELDAVSGGMKWTLSRMIT